MTELCVCVGQVRHCFHSHLETVVGAERLPAGSPGGDRCVLGRGRPPVGLPSVPGLQQHHHVGVHVPPSDLLPQALRHRGEPLRQRAALQPVGLLLCVSDRGLGESVRQGQSERSVTTGYDDITGVHLFTVATPLFYF